MQEETISYANALFLKFSRIYGKEWRNNKNLLGSMLRALKWTDSTSLCQQQKIIGEIVHLSSSSMLDRFIPQVNRHTADQISDLHSFPDKIWKRSEESLQQAFSEAALHGCTYISIRANKITDSEIRLAKEFKVKILAYGCAEQQQIDDLGWKGVSGFYLDSYRSVKSKE